MSTTDDTTTLFDAQQTETDVTENLVLRDGTVVLGHDPMSPIDTSDIDGHGGGGIADWELVEY